MVKETRIVFELSDVLTVRVTCSKCHKEVAIRCGGEDRGGFDTRCLWCKASWNGAAERLNSLLGMIDRFDHIYGEVMSVQLELDGEECQTTQPR